MRKRLGDFPDFEDEALEVVGTLKRGIWRDVGLETDICDWVDVDDLGEVVVEIIGCSYRAVVYSD